VTLQTRQSGFLVYRVFILTTVLVWSNSIVPFQCLLNSRIQILWELPHCLIGLKLVYFVLQRVKSPEAIYTSSQQDIRD